jgi:hypothetical protein
VRVGHDCLPVLLDGGSLGRFASPLYRTP